MELEALDADEGKFCMMIATLFQSGSQRGNIYIVNVSEHKTGVGGMAKLMIRKDLKKKKNN